MRSALRLLATTVIVHNVAGCSLGDSGESVLDGSISGPYERTAFGEHNKYRAMHGSPTVVWDDGLALRAQARADACQLGESNVGENVASGHADVASAIAGWYAEETRYNFAAPGENDGTKHFTQLVWKSSARVGCAEAQCSFGRLDVCAYDPPGNVAGQFVLNVFPPGKNDATSVIPSADSGFCDDKELSCAYLASTGHCQSDADFTLLNCCHSCTVRLAALKACPDTNEDCAFWAYTGQCDVAPEFMHVQCCASCSRVGSP